MKNVLCASFPEYDWTKNIIGDNPGKLNLQLLNRTGADMHSYQPTIADMVKIANCDLLIYNGGASQFWIADALDAYPNPHRQVLSLMQLFETQPDRFPAYTQDDEHDHVDHIHNHSEHDDHDAHDHDAHEHEDETDEHLWLSLKMTREFCLAAASQLSTLNPAAAAAYQTNASAYIQKLDALDRKFTELTQQTACKTLLFADRFPFKYFCDDYGLAHEAAFPGCSAETGASFETVVFLSNKVKELNLSAPLVTESSDGRMAKTVAENAGNEQMPVLTLNSMQSVSAEQAKTLTYLSVMTENLTVLQQALSEGGTQDAPNRM